jgi:hypothetical protein
MAGVGARKFSSQPQEIDMHDPEENIPIPPRRGAKYDFRSILSGQSRFYPAEGADNDLHSHRVRSAVSMFRRRNPDRKFECRSVEGGVRVWRTE